jgi:microcystin-dependent protein
MASTALLATVADAKASQLAGGVAPVMPAGVILPFGGATAPTGWLVCDGSQVSRSQYADLFAAIGTAHGAGDGSSTFHLPDFRGRFLRGADGGAARDPDRASRTAANSGGAVGDAVGSVQGNATAKNGLSGTAAGQSYDVANRGLSSGSAGSGGSHQHGFNVNLQHTDGSYTSGESFDAGLRQGGRRRYGDVTNYDGTHGHSVSGSTDVDHTHAASAVTVASSDSETRPTNANVNYIIKV